MSLRLYFHPLSSFSHKVLTALYENGTPFAGEVVNFMDPVSWTAFTTLWPIARFPVLRDEERGKTVPESTVIIEYLDRHFPGRTRFIPEDPETAEAARAWDRFLDLYVHVPMQKVVTDRLRPDGSHDAYGVDQAKDLLNKAYDLLDAHLGTDPWLCGSDFTLADCAAAGPLRFADMQVPIGARRNLAAYLERLKVRPSYARAWNEAEPYLAMVPQ